MNKLSYRFFFVKILWFVYDNTLKYIAQKIAHRQTIFPPIFLVANKQLYGQRLRKTFTEAYENDKNLFKLLILFVMQYILN